LARARIDCTSGTDAGVSEVEEGIRLVRTTAGPDITKISLSS